MGSPSQIVQISLGSGLNQRGDARAANPPTLDIARDVQFDELGGLQTRKPQAALSNNIFGGGTLSSCRKIVPNGDELLCFTDVALYSWNAQLAAWVLKGTHLAVKVDEHTAFAATGDQIDCDRAELGNTIIYTWVDVMAFATAKVFVAAIDKTTGSVLMSPTTIGGVGTRPRLVALATKIMLFWHNGTDAVPISLQCIAIDPASPATAVAGAATAVLATPNFNLMYDATRIIGTDTAIVAARRITTTSYSIITVTAALVVTASTKARTCDGPIAVSSTPDGLNIQVARTNNTNIQGDLVLVAGLADVFTAQAIGTINAFSCNQITAAHRSVKNGGQYRCYVFWDDSESLSSGWVSKSNWVDDGNALGAQATFVRVLAVASRAFDYNGSVYFWGTFGGQSQFSGVSNTFGAQLQNTYFLYRDDGFLCAKAAYDRGGGLCPSTGRLAGVALTSGSKTFSWCGAERRLILLGTQQKGYGARAPHEITFTFDSNEARRSVRLGQTLYIATGEGVLQYDGAGLYEVGFNVYPWNFGAIEIAGASMANTPPPATYSYKSTLRWDNAKGERDRSTTATVGDVTMTTGHGVSIVASTPLYITHKTAVAPSSAPAVEYWRTEINPPEDAPFKLITSKDPSVVANPNRYIVNDMTAASLPTLNDDLTDVALRKLEANPENGAVLENLAPPAASIIIATDTRLFLAGVAGDLDRVWYSKQRAAGEVAAFNDALTINVPGPGGLITALAILNETLVVFRETAIYAFPGVGFDNESGGQNYGPAQIISLDVGAVNHEAQALIDAGVIFKSSKGWHILDKRWSVNYIGAPVVDFDGDAVYAVHVVRAQQQVRVLTNSRVVFFDYVAKEWGEWTITDGIDAAIWQGTYAYLTATGPKTEQAAYTSLTYGLDVEWAWIKMADLQGAGRVRRILILGEFRSDHVVRIRIAYNYKTDGAGGWLYTDDKYWTPSPTTVGDPEQFKIGPSLQQCEAIKIRITAANPAKATLKINVPGSSGSQWMLITVRRPGTAGNAIVFTNDAGAGPTVPTITDGVGTVALSSGAATTFQQVVDAINASSSLISAAMGGAGGGHVFTGTSFTGSPAGGLDWPTGEALKLTGLALELAVNPALNKRLPAAQRT